MSLSFKIKRVRFDDKKYKSYQSQNTKGIAKLALRHTRPEIPIATKRTYNATKVVSTESGHSVQSPNFMRRPNNGEPYDSKGRMGFKDSKNKKNRNKYEWLQRGKKKAVKNYKPVGRMNQCLTVKNGKSR